MVNAFKFQSDSINTRSVYSGLRILISFKFQSDSINTELISGIIQSVYTALNSNLILLILNFTELADSN